VNRRLEQVGHVEDVQVAGLLHEHDHAHHLPLTPELDGVQVEQHLVGRVVACGV
jgi:hypothetical protein